MADDEVRNKAGGQALDLARDMDVRFDAAEAFGGVAALAREQLPPPAPEGASRQAYLRFERAAEQRARSRSAARLLRFPLVAAAGVAAVALGVWRFTTPAPLAITVEGGAIEEGGYVRAAAVDSEPALRFSDGTEVKLGRSSRLRLAETRGEGARLLLEEGRAHARVVPRKRSRWVFDAGPCRVQVTGTRFEMRWSPAEQLLDVLLYSGSVTVKGPPAEGGVAVRAGQRLTMDVRKGSVRLIDLAAAESGGAALGAPDDAFSRRSLTAPPPPAAAAAGAVPAAAAPPPVSARAGAAARRHDLADGSWPARVLAGEFHSVIDEAERRGVAEVLRRESAGNVMALADAARYAGAAPLATRALLEVRARFPRSAPARRAAFLLGRMAEDQDGDLRKALEWYRTYLADARDDGFRAEALGRQMTATLRLSGTDAARPMAAEYLRRYPRGAYAEAAQAIAAQAP